MNNMIKPVLLLAFFVVLAHLQTDPACETVSCPPNFRCAVGICIRQKYAPKKKLCTFNLGASVIKCTNRDYFCDNVASSPTCGYTFQGQKRDYNNDCQPCLNQQISFYYPSACAGSPDICLENEECINGKCLKLFTNQKYKDYRTCSSNKDCRAIVERCVAGKCVKLTELASTLKKQKKNIPKIRRGSRF